MLKLYTTSKLPRWREIRIYVEIVHYVKLSFRPLRIYFLLAPARISLGNENPRIFLLGIPLCFCWRLGINSFWLQLVSLLELSRWHLKINSVWCHIRSPLRFAIPGDSFSVIPPCFLLLGLLWLFVCGELHFPPLRVYYYYIFLGNYINHQSTYSLCYLWPIIQLRKYICPKY